MAPSTTASHSSPAGPPIASPTQRGCVRDQCRQCPGAVPWHGLPVDHRASWLLWRRWPRGFLISGGPDGLRLVRGFWMTISINQYLYKETLHMEGIRIGNALSPRTTLFPNTPFFILALAAPVPDIRNRESFVFPVVPFLEPHR